MTQNLSEVTSFPCPCPGCGIVAGFPYCVCTDATHTDQVRVDVRCRHCKQEWQLTRTLGLS